MPRVWLITGCSRGLGRALADAVLADGDHLLATARNPAQLDDLVDRHGDQVRVVALDVTDPAAARAAVRTAVDTFGRLDILVNNAGYADVAAIEDMSEDDFRAQIEANFFGVVNLSRAALPVMREQGRGHIVQISSVGSRVASTGLGAYQSAKWAVSGFSAVLAKEVEAFGIRITSVEPGGLRTDWAGSSMSALPISEPYRPVIDPAVQRLRQASGAQPGDPARAAQAIIRITRVDEPPLRLLLGADAVAAAQAAAEALAASDARWRELSGSIAFDAAP
ncbi:NAD(P)-dependent dehydrogenase (short-subunit alcohol dehydrogenase family) [Micromonospora vinacea]|uniref:NAD(P)-dependent dehydrogenase (Short-subunit alcohol dehydrogenase family) n=1 Tax=Micromonospora vinacea TaxID=709878 RepID=A0ABS0K8U4_9ACTN|nr:oxidoreductase [Micromonospora vinacea]MBG6105063.1 NAD(P)-dependent dehydrogenase (short-subunit alcohol dehydrogenase family) [Micromonospora vinacea]